MATLRPDLNLPRQGSWTVNLVQEPDGSIRISGKLDQLERGFHRLIIAESADFTDGCDSAGDILTFADKTINGDLGLTVANMVGQSEFRFNLKTVDFSGSEGLIGRSIVVVQGHSSHGPRVACGVIGFAK